MYDIIPPKWTDEVIKIHLSVKVGDFIISRKRKSFLMAITSGVFEETVSKESR